MEHTKFNRRRFIAQTATAVAAAPLLGGLAGCGHRADLTPNVYGGAGGVFLKHLNALSNFPDANLMSKLKTMAASSPSAQKVGVGAQLLGAYGGATSVPLPIPQYAPQLSFPADHGEHFDTQLEWRYIALSLPLSNGGLFSMVATFFRSSIADAVDAPDLAPIDRQIYSTSIGVTIEMPEVPGVHYYLPTTAFSAIDGPVTVTNEPFQMSIGVNSITGTSNVFPMHVHIEDAGGDGRPPISLDIDCAATNPLFLQGVDGYVGSPIESGQTQPATGYYYYSWPQQSTTGNVMIDGTSYGVSNGIAWFDHQWGGSPVAKSGPVSPWSGWCWFEFQFDGNRSLTLSVPHGAIVGGQIAPGDLTGFGTYIDNGTSTFVVGTLQVSSYEQSPNSDARYPSGWTLNIANYPLPGAPTVPIALVVTPVAAIQPQTLYFASLVEYSEANSVVTAAGTINGNPATLSGVGYCEGVGFEDPTEYNTRAEAFLTT